MSVSSAPVSSDFRTRAKANDVPIARLIGFEAKEIAAGRATVTLAAGPSLKVTVYPKSNLPFNLVTERAKT